MILASTHSQRRVAELLSRAVGVAVAGGAFWEAFVAQSAAVAPETGELRPAETLTRPQVALRRARAHAAALARLTARHAVVTPVTFLTLLTLRAVCVRRTDTLARVCVTVSVCVRAVTR